MRGGPRFQGLSPLATICRPYGTRFGRRFSGEGPSRAALAAKECCQGRKPLESIQRKTAFSPVRGERTATPPVALIGKGGLLTIGIPPSFTLVGLGLLLTLLGPIQRAQKLTCARRRPFRHFGAALPLLLTLLPRSPIVSAHLFSASRPPRQRAGRRALSRRWEGTPDDEMVDDLDGVTGGGILPGMLSSRRPVQPARLWLLRLVSDGGPPGRAGSHLFELPGERLYLPVSGSGHSSVRGRRNSAANLIWPPDVILARLRRRLSMPSGRRPAAGSLRRSFPAPAPGWSEFAG
jgi:hypothetical protein